MDLIDQPDEVGSWKKEKVLGAGGFGYVVLWRNKESNETIALKQCRWGHDPMMTPKNRSRWKLEVDMMSRLNHPNVVKAIPVPPELDVPATELPLLAMEYCSSGDLRKLLNKPENCCGLREKHVRLLLMHISSAVDYLHSIRIIHRDLKPENIVIQDVNGNVIYKLIDLGYAKELDQGSLCTSFVGTLQYLAPELFMSQKYSCTVDYWSLGLVTHEVITGVRPFLPDKSPAEWIPVIRQKSSSQIRAYLDKDKNIVFTSEISPHHHICSIFKKDIEKWLQMMLEWDPKKRGRKENVTAFSLLHNMLSRKVILVFCISTFKLISLSLDQSASFADFRKQLELESGIPVDRQEMLLPKGDLPSEEKGINQLLCNLQEEEKIIFLFHKTDMLSALPTIYIPSDIENMMLNPRTEVSYAEQRVTWSQAVYMSHQECILFSRLVQAFKANLMNLLNKVSFNHKNMSRMMTEMHKLSAKCSFLQKSLEQDLNSYNKQVQNGFTAQNMIDGWKNNLENLKKIDLLRQKVATVEESSLSINARTVELQRSSYARSKYNNPLEDTHNRILDIFSELKRRTKEQKQVNHDNTDIVRLLCQCLQQRASQVQDIITCIRNTSQIKQEIDNVMPEISNLITEISEWDLQVDAWQSKRQQALWKVIDALTDKIHSIERQSSSPVAVSSSPQSTMPRKHSTALDRPVFARYNPESGVHSPQELNKFSSAYFKSISPPVIPLPPSQNKLESISTSSSYLNEHFSDRMKLNSSISSVPLSSLLDKTTLESQRIKRENQELVESLQNMMEMFKSYQETDGTGQFETPTNEDS